MARCAPRMTFTAVAVSIGLFAWYWSGAAAAQNALGDGQSLDNNLQVGSSGRNTAAPQQQAEHPESDRHAQRRGRARLPRRGRLLSAT